jgi:preprotein translocase subunit SecA
MRAIYEWLGLRVAAVGQGTRPEERRAAYRADVTYATANEVGFDLLRDQLAFRADEQVHRAFAVAVIDEADSILIDEARIPLVIAGGASGPSDLPGRRTGRPLWFRANYHTAHEGRRGSDADPQTEHSALLQPVRAGAPQLLDGRSGRLTPTFSAAGIDYLVKDGAVVSIDDQDALRRAPVAGGLTRRWSGRASLEGQGRILGSMTVENLVPLPQACGMTERPRRRRAQEVYGPRWRRS